MNRLASFALIAAALGSCATEHEPCEQLIKIDKDRVKPSIYTATQFDLGEAGAFFEVKDAITIACPIDKRRIWWYYDYEPGLDVDTWQICGGTEQCFLTPCKLAKPHAKSHTLTAVVADGPRTAKSTTMMDFPPGTQFDSVSWNITAKGACK